MQRHHFDATPDERINCVHKVVYPSVFWVQGKRLNKGGAQSFSLPLRHDYINATLGFKPHGFLVPTHLLSRQRLSELPLISHVAGHFFSSTTYAGKILSSGGLPSEARNFVAPA